MSVWITDGVTQALRLQIEPRSEAHTGGIAEGAATQMRLGARRLPADQQARAGTGLDDRPGLQRQRGRANAASADFFQQWRDGQGIHHGSICGFAGHRPRPTKPASKITGEPPATEQICILSDFQKAEIGDIIARPVA